MSTPSVCTRRSFRTWLSTRSYFWIVKNCFVKTFGFSIADFEQVQRILGDVDHTYFIAEFSRASGRS